MASGTGSMRGNGTTFALSSGSVGAITMIDPGEESIVDIPDDQLATTDDHENIPGLLVTHAPFGLEAILDPDAVPALGGVVTATMTFPIRTGQTVGATYAGTGYTNRRKVTSIENDVRVLVELGFMFDGKTGPVYTAGS